MKKIIKLKEQEFKNIIKNVINEYKQNIVYLTDGQINYYNERWKNGTNIKYTNNGFYKNLMNKVNKTKRLTKKQKWFLDFLFSRGESPYDAGILPSNY